MFLIIVSKKKSNYKIKVDSIVKIILNNNFE